MEWFQVFLVAVEWPRLHCASVSCVNVRPALDLRQYVNFQNEMALIRGAVETAVWR